MSEILQSSVHNKSSTIQNRLRPTYRETLLQSCENELLSAEYIYSYFDQRDTTEKLLRLRSCRTGAFFYRNRDTGAIRVGAQSCHLRHCPICTKSRELTIKTNVADWLRTTIYPKIITFTLKHNNDTLTGQLNRLYDSFRSVRRLSILKNKCHGGVWFFQVKKSKTDGMWHPHIHCLVSGSYIQQKKLSKAWLKITGDSKIVDIRLVRNVESTAKDVARYAAKPCILVKLSLDECLEIAEALEKRRLCGSWGICRKLRITSQPKLDTESWNRLASWNAVYENRNVDDNAKAIIEAWKTGKPLPADINLEHLYDPQLFNTEVTERGSPLIDNQTYFEWKGR